MSLFNPITEETKLFLSLVKKQDFMTICDMISNEDIMQIEVIIRICELDDAYAYQQIVSEMSKRGKVLSDANSFIDAALGLKSLKLLNYFVSNNYKFNIYNDTTVNEFLRPNDIWRLSYAIDNALIDVKDMLTLHRIATFRKDKKNIKLENHIEKIRSHLVSRGIDSFIPKNDGKE